MEYLVVVCWLLSAVFLKASGDALERTEQLCEALCSWYHVVIISTEL